jgi:hypothetical protein
MMYLEQHLGISAERATEIAQNHCPFDSDMTWKDFFIEVMSDDDLTDIEKCYVIFVAGQTEIYNASN